MENFDLTKLSGNELLELRAKISKEIDARENTKKNELAEAVIQSIKDYTNEYGELKIEIKDYTYFYFTSGDKYNFYPNESIIVIS